jgi:hypothetical protein
MTNWEWLMEVVDKIESLASSELKQDGFVFQIGEIYSSDVNIYEIKYRRLASFLTIPYQHKVIESEYLPIQFSNKKEAVYKACVEFIKWYVEQTNIIK